MKLLATCALLCLAPTLSIAQTTDADRYSYCQVQDSGNHDIWVSLVFATPPGADSLGTAMAAEFHGHVGALGGSGDKSCVLAATRAGADEARANAASILGKRIYGIRAYTWHDVNWTPSAAASAAPLPTETAQYVYCRLTDVATRVLASSDIFVQTLPAKTELGYYDALTRYGLEFGALVTTHGVDGSDAQCIASDSAAEASKSRADYKKLFGMSRVKKLDLQFVPAPAPAAEGSGT